ncbi:MAG: radical SAM protein [Clostridiales bacterium]|nr:radical SAM protein [Clostridiales bacterium]
MGRIFSIEEFSTFDGPGIRTTVFLKGCPLKCAWCHNPEGQAFEKEYMRSPNGCLGCKKCEDESGRLTEKSIGACPRNLVRAVGEEYTPQRLADKILKNAEILRASGGGVTFSGGEPLSQSQFIVDCVSRLNGLHAALQTSGFANCETFESVLSVCDFVLYDLKIMDDDAHRQWCGVGNEKILKNYDLLVKSGKAFVTRIPLIPSVTDTRENLSAIARFIKDKGVEHAELLPYNKMAGGKYKALQRRYAPNFDETNVSQNPERFLAEYGIKAKIM